MKNYKPKSEIIIKEIIEETLTPSAPCVEAFILDDILSYRRTNINTPRIILQQRAPNLGGVKLQMYQFLSKYYKMVTHLLKKKIFSL